MEQNPKNNIEKLIEEKGCQFRDFRIETRELEDTNDLIVEGIACTFNQPTVLFESDGILYKEQVDPNSFAETKMDDVIFNYNHSGRVYARTRNNTLQLSVEQDGLHMRAVLRKDDEGHKQLYEDIKSGTIDRMSFAFTVNKDSYDRDNHMRTILGINRLFDVSAVDIPAYDTTEISARSFFEAESLKELEEIEERERLAAEEAEKIKSEDIMTEERRAELSSELSEMTIEQVAERLAQYDPETRDAEMSPAELEEKALIEERHAELVELEERNKAVEELTNETAENTETIEEKGEIEMEERKIFGTETKEYRDAFYAHLVGQANEEQRAIVADTSAYGDGLALPVSTDTAIWDQITTAHPILADVAKISSGIAIKVTQMTPAAVTKKKDSAASTEQTFTGLDVVLVGADYHTYVTLSYAEAKMSAGAMESFLVSEIAGALGEALAKDIFARIESDAAANSVTATSDLFKDIKDALGKAVQAARPVIYAPADKYYEIVGAIKSGSPFNIGSTLGCEVKLDTAAAHVTVVDPKMFVLNEINGVLIESERDAKNAQYVIGGWMRAEGCMRKTAAAAFIA